MHIKHIFCSTCGRTYKPNKLIFRCERCNGSLEVILDYNKIRKTLTRGKLQSRSFNHSRYKELYPVKNLLSIQEGGTPLVRSRNLEKELGIKGELYFKYEAQNPTGSFKDRGSSVEIAKAMEFHARRAVCASTGNMGASLSAYSAIASLDCHIYTPTDAAPLKIEQILAYGAKLHRVKGGYTKASRIVEKEAKQGSYLLGDYLYRREGTKSVGYEILEQAKPDFVFTPVGNGTLISSTWKAFREFKTLGFTKYLPRIVGIQAQGCSPLVRAFKNNAQIIPVKNPKTIAVAIECGAPLDGERALKAVKESKGLAESVSDKEILKARILLAKREGLFAEPAGAVSLAGLIKHKEKIPKGSKIVCVITGHGLKVPITKVK